MSDTIAIIAKNDEIEHLRKELSDAKDGMFRWQNAAIDIEKKLTIAIGALEKLANHQAPAGVGARNYTRIATQALAKLRKTEGE